MERHRIVDLAADPALAQERAELVPPTTGEADRVLVPHVPAEPEIARSDDARLLAKRRGVDLRVLGAGHGPRLEVLELDRENHRLERVQPTVGPDLVVVVTRLHAVIAEQTHAIGERCVVGGDEPTIARAAQVLRRIEREGAELGHAADRSIAVGRADRLRRILDHRRFVPASDLANRIEVGRLPKEMHHHHRLRSR